MASSGILERIDATRSRVGLALRMIGNHASHSPGANDLARHVMNDLATATRSTVRLGVLAGLAVTYVERPAGSGPRCVRAGASPAPPHATAMGTALLAFLPAWIVRDVIFTGLPRYTPFTLTTPEELRRSLARTRLTQVAVTAREYTLESSTVAAPAFGTGGTVIAAVEAEARDPQADLHALRPAVRVTARSLTRELATNNVRGTLTITVSPQRSEVAGD
jgi:DNA-binding IclR family transcriptional regulator